MRKLGPKNPIIRRLLLIIFVVIIFIVIIIFSLKTILNSNALNYDIGERVYGTKYEDIIVKNYDDYKNLIAKYNIANDLKANDFANNSYLASFQEFDSCSEYRKKYIDNIVVNDNNINVDVIIYNKCGWCKSHMILYLIKMDKIESNNIDYNINYNYSYEKELNCGNAIS